ncbi:MAG: hypothetical protein VX473_02575, partial [Candidatus Thermoplasmatota archaeon]|nr:hypothetical protein [Candidatus Thermoplasmatota archaeon]
MVRPGCLALILTSLMLTSGCLGMFEGEDEDPELIMKESIPIDLSLTGDTEFEYNQPVILSGLCNCEELDATITASIGNGAIQGAVEVGTDTFTADFGILPTGTYSVLITMKNEISTFGTEVLSVTVTILSPPEDPVSISAFPPVLYVEGGESTIARAKIVHSALNTCSGIWEDELERVQTVAITGEYAAVALGEVESSFNGTFTISCGSTEITTDTTSVYVFVFTEENPDLDGDGIPDENDRCVESSIAFTSGPTNDIDGDGCYDISEDTDDDDDGRPDSSDLCPRGLIGWDSTDIELD